MRASTTCEPYDSRAAFWQGPLRSWSSTTRKVCRAFFCPGCLTEEGLQPCTWSATVCPRFAAVKEHAPRRGAARRQYSRARWIRGVSAVLRRESSHAIDTHQSSSPGLQAREQARRRAWWLERDDFLTKPVDIQGAAGARSVRSARMKAVHTDDLDSAGNDHHGRWRRMIEAARWLFRRATAIAWAKLRPPASAGPPRPE